MCTAWWRLPLLLVFVLVAIILTYRFGIFDLAPTSNDSARHQPADGPTAEHVSLSIDFGNGQRMDFDAIDWHGGLMVADLLNAASSDLAITQRGSGQAALLTAIEVHQDDLAGKAGQQRPVGCRRVGRCRAVADECGQQERESGQEAAWVGRAQG
jgi:hypothetical protein